MRAVLLVVLALLVAAATPVAWAVPLPAAVAVDELRPGDLVFFNTMRRAFSHVGIYVGDGRFVHAPASGGAVRIEDMRLAYWSRRFNGARRAPATAALASAGFGAAGLLPDARR